MRNAAVMQFSLPTRNAKNVDRLQEKPSFDPKPIE